MEAHLAFLCDQAADQATSDRLTTGIIYATLDAADSRSVGFADQVTRNRSNSINHDSTTHVLTDYHDHHRQPGPRTGNEAHLKEMLGW